MFLTKNGIGKYAVVEIQECDMLIRDTLMRYLSKLEHAVAQPDKNGWVSEEDFDTRMNLLLHE